MKEKIRNAVELLLSIRNPLKKKPGGILLFYNYNRGIAPVIWKAWKEGRKIRFFPERFKEHFDLQKPELDYLKPRFDRLRGEIRRYLALIAPVSFATDKVPRDELGIHALLSIKDASCIKVYLDHGEDGAIHDEVIYNRGLFDYAYFTTSSMCTYAWLTFQKYGLKTTVRQWDRYCGNPPPRRKKQGKKKMLLVIPALNCGDLLIHLLPETYKYQFRKKLLVYLDGLAKEWPDLEVVWKKFPPGDLNDDMVGSIIKEEKLRIRLETRDNLHKLLPKAWAVVTDCISTPIYDAARMGIPSLPLIHPRSSRLRDDIRRDWGPCMGEGDPVRLLMEYQGESLISLIGYFVKFLMNGGTWSIPKVARNNSLMPWEV